MPGESKVISAEVMLVSASGRRVGAQTALTAETIAEFLPSSETQTRARQAFEAAGFDVSQALALGFSITGPPRLFEDFFNTGLEPDTAGGLLARQPDGSQSRELPLDALARSLRDLLVTVTFTEPPDFGPGNF